MWLYQGLKDMHTTRSVALSRRSHDLRPRPRPRGLLLYSALVKRVRRIVSGSRRHLEWQKVSCPDVAFPGPWNWVASTALRQSTCGTFGAEANRTPDLSTYFKSIVSSAMTSSSNPVVLNTRMVARLAPAN